MERSATSITLMWDSGNPLAVSYYIIQYRPASSTDPFKEIDAIATTRYSVGGLSPYSHYHFRVVAVNSIGRGPPSQTVETRTAEQAPSSPPRRVRGRMLSGSTAMMQWEEPEEANGQVVGYRVYYTSDSSLSCEQWEKEMVRGANFWTYETWHRTKPIILEFSPLLQWEMDLFPAICTFIAKTGGVQNVKLGLFYRF